MKKFILQILPAVFSVPLWMPGVAAQEDVEEPRFCEVSVFVPPLKGFITETTRAATLPRVYYWDGEQDQALTLVAGRASRPVRMMLREELKLYTVERDTDSETGEPVVTRTPFLSCAIPEGWEQVVVLVDHAGRETRGYPIRTDPSRIPEGRVALYNLLNEPLRVIVDEGGAEDLAAGALRVYEPEQEREVSLVVGRMVDGELQIGFKGRRRIDPEGGNLLLLTAQGVSRVRVYPFEGL